MLYFRVYVTELSFETAISALPHTDAVDNEAHGWSLGGIRNLEKAATYGTEPNARVIFTIDLLTFSKIQDTNF